jgi:hypothetical protein
VPLQRKTTFWVLKVNCCFSRAISAYALVHYRKDKGKGLPASYTTVMSDNSKGPREIIIKTNERESSEPTLLMLPIYDF